MIGTYRWFSTWGVISRDSDRLLSQSPLAGKAGFPGLSAGPGPIEAAGSAAVKLKEPEPLDFLLAHF